MRRSKPLFALLFAQTSILLIFGWLLVGKLAHADEAIVTPAVPHVISYQGMLADSSGRPLTASKNISATIYEAAEGGGAKWTELHARTPVSNGVFSLMLGETTPILDSLFAQPDRWLELVIDGVTLTPRQKFTSVPYTLRAESAANADKVGGKSAQDLASETWYTNVNGWWSNQAPYSESYYSTQDGWGGMYTSFLPSPLADRKVQITYTRVVSRTGVYTGAITLDFVVKDASGAVVRTVSGSTIDLQTAALNTWVSAPVSANSANLIIHAGEFLQPRITRAGDAGGDFVAYLYYAAVVGK